jgi:hypothetical protein
LLATLPRVTSSIILTAMRLDRFGGSIPIITVAAIRFVSRGISASAAMLVSLELGIDALGNSFALPPLPLAITLPGELMLAGDSATIVGMSPLAFGQLLLLNVALPQFPLPLPTILPPGGTPIYSLISH